MPPSVFISVADPSADANAALLARELTALRPTLTLRGIGGGLMAHAGVALLADTVARSAMGLAALGRALEVRRLLARIAADFDHDPPALVICIDSWSLNAHVAALAKARKIPVLYYVAPQTWASREGRVNEMRTLIDHLACILPFEEPYFRAHGLPTTYVGHPLWDRLPTPPQSGPPAPPQSAIRNPQSAITTPHPTSHIPHPTYPTLAILPGSRRGVVAANFPRLLEVMARLRSELPGVRFRIPVVANVAAAVKAYPLPPDTEVGVDAIDTLLPGCDLALCVSGTAALHVAAHNVPLIVVYHGNPLLWHLLGRWIIRTRTYSLVNLLNSPEGGGGRTLTQGHHIAPEYIPWYGPTTPVATHALHLLKNPADLQAMRTALARVIAPLAHPGASHRTAQLALSLLPPTTHTSPT